MDQDNVTQTIERKKALRAKNDVAAITAAEKVHETIHQRYGRMPYFTLTTVVLSPERKNVFTATVGGALRKKRC
ncbi:MAG: hypothetical protein WAU28_00065 [Candidatus Moraniibacteriota bacterium]